MQLLVIRHAKAKSREKFARSDVDDMERPLTRKGAKAFAGAVEGLRKRVDSIGMLISSPATRAMQTAEIISQAYGNIAVAPRAELGPGAAPDAPISWLSRHTAAGTIALVGHEPNLSEMLKLLLRTESASVSSLKKGAVCLVAFDHRVGAHTGTLVWTATRKQLAAYR